MTKLHYFNQEKSDPDDIQLKMAIRQGYVPSTCLLNGRVIWTEITEGRDPCAGCKGPREQCKGR